MSATQPPRHESVILDGKTNDALLWNAPPPPPRRPRPTEPVWSMRKAGKQTDCVLQGVAEDGWDVLLLRDGDCFYGRRWTTRTLALQEVEELRQELERDGWQNVAI